MRKTIYPKGHTDLLLQYNCKRKDMLYYNCLICCCWSCFCLFVLFFRRGKGEGGSLFRGFEAAFSTSPTARYTVMST